MTGFLVRYRFLWYDSFSLRSEPNLIRPPRPQIPYTRYSRINVCMMFCCTVCDKGVSSEHVLAVASLKELRSATPKTTIVCERVVRGRVCFTSYCVCKSIAVWLFDGEAAHPSRGGLMHAVWGISLGYPLNRCLSIERIFKENINIPTSLATLRGRRYICLPRNHHEAQTPAFRKRSCMPLNSPEAGIHRPLLSFP